MNYKLAKELKDNGFIQSGEGKRSMLSNPVKVEFNIWKGKVAFKGDKYKNHCYEPTLSELIEACGDLDEFCLATNKNEWKAMYGNSSDVAVLNEWDGDTWATGETPEIAVAKLWLKLNKK